ncbi:MAG: DUF1761 family protein [Cryobacterium sp.]
MPSGSRRCSAWDRSIGYDRSAGGGRFPLAYYIIPLLGAVVGTSVIAAFILTSSATGAIDGAVVGAGVGVAIAAASVTNALTPHTPEPYLFGAITGGYHLVACTLCGALIGIFG